MSEALQIFEQPEEASFVERPNRFVMMVRDRRGELLRAHCPNSGKLTEFLVPGQELLIQRHRNPSRSTHCSVVAVRYKEKLIFLRADRANRIAEELVLPGLFPGAEIRPEWSLDGSRFDFLIRGAKETLVEVKSCTLGEYGIAMFPDAPTDRGSRHVRELVRLVNQGYDARVLFVIAHRDTRRFMPNPHTDPEFCITLDEASKLMPVGAVSVDTDEEGWSRVVNGDVPVETRTAAELARANAGAYVLLIRLSKPLRLSVMSLGEPDLAAGYYLYAGSARTNLRQRLARHQRKRKKHHWHVDYLIAGAESVRVFPIRSFLDLECAIAGDLSELAEAEVPGFGSSDCRCDSHLFYFSQNPFQQRRVLDRLLWYRHVGFESLR